MASFLAMATAMAKNLHCCKCVQDFPCNHSRWAFLILSFTRVADIDQQFNHYVGIITITVTTTNELD